MIGRFSIAAISVCIGACASSGPEAPAPAETAVVPATTVAAPASVDATATDQPSAAPAGEIHELDAPGVEMTAKALPGDESDEIICRRERETGTKMSKRVCRRRSDIEARAAEDQGKVREMRKINTGSHDALNN